MRALPISLIAALLAAPAYAGEPVRAGGFGRILEPMLLSDEVYTESFVVITDFDDGTYVFHQLGISNAGPGDAHAGCRILIHHKDVAKNFTSSVIFDREQWSYDAAKGPSLRVDKCTWTAGKTFEVSSSIGGATFELSLDANIADFRQTVMQAKDGDDFYDLEVLIPWAKARAKLSRPGEEPKVLSGFGYLDHSRSTALPGQSAKRWVRFRGFGAKSSKLFLVRVPPKAPPDHEGWFWAEGANRTSISRISMIPSKKPGPDAQWKVMLDGDGGPWRITTSSLIYRDAPLEDQGTVGSMLGAIVGNPVTYVYRATLASKLEKKEIPGVFEITITD